MLTPGILATEPDPDDVVIVIETPWRTVREAARYCRCSHWTIRKAAKNRELRSSGGGRGKPLLFLEEWLDAWLEDNH